MERNKPKVKKNAPAEPKRINPGCYAEKSQEKYSTILKSMQEDSQCYLILKHILEHGSITPKEAEKKPIWCMRLSARIWDLRRKHNIPIETDTVKKRRGKKTISYASYYIGG